MELLSVKKLMYSCAICLTYWICIFLFYLSVILMLSIKYDSLHKIIFLCSINLKYIAKNMK